MACVCRGAEQPLALTLYRLVLLRFTLIQVEFRALFYAHHSPEHLLALGAEEGAGPDTGLQPFQRPPRVPGFTKCMISQH